MPCKFNGDIQWKLDAKILVWYTWYCIFCNIKSSYSGWFHIIAGFVHNDAKKKDIPTDK